MFVSIDTKLAISMIGPLKIPKKWQIVYDDFDVYWKNDDQNRILFDSLIIKQTALPV